MQSDKPANNAADSRPEKPKTGCKMDFSKCFLLSLLLGVLVLFIFMIKFFIVPIIVAGVLCSLFYPLYQRFVHWTRGKTALSSAITCVILLLVLLIPLYILVNIVINQAIALYESGGPSVDKLFASGRFNLEQLAQHPLLEKLKLDQVDWRATIQEGISTISSYASKLINATSRGTFLFLTNLLVTLFTMFYFFKDGERIVAQIMAYLPMGEEYKQQIVSRFNSISRATIKGTVILGVIQGVLGGLTLWIFGFKAVVLWGMVMVILSLLPVVGSYLILIPAAIYEIATGNTGNGIGILVISVLVISNIDNFLRPRLVGRDAGMHDLMVYFSTLGGIGFFGIMGFIVGPVLASLLITLLDIYSLEFHGQIKRQKAEED